MALLAGGSVTNNSGGVIATAYLNAVLITGAAGTIDNSGIITGSAGNGVILTAGGSVTNNAGGRIVGNFYGVEIGGASGTLENAGIIIGTLSDGVALAGGLVSNLSGGVISGYAGVALAAGGTVIDAGTITGAGGTAVYFGAGNSLLVLDPGFVLGGAAVAARTANALELASGGSGGTLTGLGTSIVNFAAVAVDSGAQWTLSGANTIGNGVTLTDGGSLTNTGTLVNGGAIAITGAGILTDPGSLFNSGSISGMVTLTSGGDLDNALGGTITAAGNAVVGGGSATVVNGGVISGGTGAVVLSGSGNLVVDDPGAVFSGVVQGGGASNDTLELASAGSPGTLSGLGSQYLGFGMVTVDSGAHWTLAGNSTIGSGVTLTDRGTVTGGTVVSGGIELVASGGVAIATTVTSGGQQVVSGGGTTSGTTISGGVENVLSGGTTSGTTIAGGVEDVLSGGTAVGVTFGGATGTLELAQPQGLSGTISSWQIGDVIDFVSTTVTSATISGSTLSITVSGGSTFNYQLANQEAHTVPTVLSDGSGGSDVELLFDGPDIGELLGAGPTGAVNKTNLLKPVFKGVGPANATIQLFDGTTLVGTGTSNAQGIWPITANALTSGTNLMTATGTDGFGRVSTSAVSTITEISGTTFSGATQTQNVNFQANSEKNTFTWGDGIGVVIAGSGTDVVSAGNGRDTVVLGDGLKDQVTLGNGNDTVTVGSGNNDKITLGGGNDTVTVGNGNNNVITLGDGSDTVTVGTGNNNKITVGNGNDTVTTNTPSGNNSQIFLGNGNDTVTGGAGNNNIALGNGSNTVTVGTGSNIIVMGGGTTTATTAAGNHPDELVFSNPNGLLTMSFASNDELVFRNAGFDLGVDNGQSAGPFGFDNLQPPQPIGASLLSPNTNGTFATTGNRFAYDQSTGNLYYDAQGSTAGSTVHQVADLTNKPHLTAANLFFTN